jgi:hypothetical protein
MAAIDLLAAARNDTFAARVGFLSMKVALVVADEAPETTDHDARIAWANEVFTNEQNNKNVAMAVIASNGTIQTAINGAPSSYGSNVSDADIEYALGQVIVALGEAILA